MEKNWDSRGTAKSYSDKSRSNSRKSQNCSENLIVSQEGQITERFTKAVNQLGAIDQKGNPALEIRLGGIYALERIANESEKDYWPIIEVLTAYIRKNSNYKEIPDAEEASLDIQAILNVIKRRKSFFTNGESIGLDLQKTLLRKVDLNGVHLERADINGAHLEGANLKGANLKGAHLRGAHLKEANLEGANLEKADLNGANLEGTELNFVHLEEAYLLNAHFEGAYLLGASLEKAYFKGASLEGAHLLGANLKGAKNLSLYQLSKVNTLYKATLDEKLLEPLKEQFPILFEKCKIILEVTEVPETE
ncbi:Pentapeptide repeat family protein [Methanosarcina sp. Kolksee]|uniref:pentapeptide repeat-containing protein n=1 Tax=Methanosarcina sp. Kolksee TaxID=1434099 RepID=UPI0006155BB6|nr:pentapeptide repeat-containing protein [Methanosarcina sp. Kolksee]AKB47425.1 Pentapeptide repeat family protein [Methanosarcina sp. Kolksee]